MQEGTTLVSGSMSLKEAVKTTVEKVEALPDSGKVIVGDTIEANESSPLLKSPALSTEIATNSDIGPTQDRTLVPGSLSLTKAVKTNAEKVEELLDSRKVVEGDTIEANKLSPLLESPTPLLEIATKSGIGPTQDTQFVPDSLSMTKAVVTTAEKVEVPDSRKVIVGNTIEANESSSLLKSPTRSRVIATKSDIGPTQGDATLLPVSLPLTKAENTTAEVMEGVPDSRKVIIGDTIEAKELSLLLKAPTPSTLQTGIATKSYIGPTQEDTILAPLSFHLTKAMNITAEIMAEVPDFGNFKVGNKLAANELSPLLKSPTPSTGIATESDIGQTQGATLVPLSKNRSAGEASAKIRTELKAVTSSMTGSEIILPKERTSAASASIPNQAS